MVVYGAAFLILVSFLCCNGSSIGTTRKEYLDNELMTNAPTVFKQQNATYVQYAKMGDSKCMKELGCFTLTADFYHSLYRPLNLLPQDRMTINTKFHLFRKDHPKESHDIFAVDLKTAKGIEFDEKLRTIFIVHGYLDNRIYGKWMETLKDDLLLQNSYNVFITDWSEGNSLPYTQAAANTRVVGAEIAYLIEYLQKTFGLSPKNCYIIGHSLGAHVAGYAGKRLKNLGRITGLDPAEPFFQYMPASVRLDRTDADFVDVIHSDSKNILLLGLGMKQPIGHLDFYPNGGESQPGCRLEPIRSIIMEGLADALRRFVGCNHQRAVDFFIHSVNHRKALPVGYQCTSWEEYLRGLCASCGSDESKCAIMGISAEKYQTLKNDSEPRKYFLTTLDKKPFWAYHYQVMIKLFKPRTKFTDQKGKITITINGQKDRMEKNIVPKPCDCGSEKRFGLKNFRSRSSVSYQDNMTLVNCTDKILPPLSQRKDFFRAMNLYHGATYKYLITTEKELGSINSVSFKWESSGFSIFSTPEIYLEKIKILPMNIIQKDEREKQEKTFCDKPNVPIKSRAIKSLTSMVCT